MDKGAARKTENITMAQAWSNNIIWVTGSGIDAVTGGRRGGELALSRATSILVAGFCVLLHLLEMPCGKSLVRLYGAGSLVAASWPPTDDERSACARYVGARGPVRRRRHRVRGTIARSPEEMDEAGAPDRKGPRGWAAYKAR